MHQPASVLVKAATRLSGFVGRRCWRFSANSYFMDYVVQCIVLALVIPAAIVAKDKAKPDTKFYFYWQTAMENS